jgi:hypothetical protein
VASADRDLKKSVLEKSEDPFLVVQVVRGSEHSEGDIEIFLVREGETRLLPPAKGLKFRVTGEFGGGNRG